LTGLILVAVLAGVACGSPAAVSTREVTLWKPMGAWSGRGVMQTEAFISTTGTLRVQWETRNEDAAGKGAFSVILHSGVSGRSLASVVEHHGVGRDTAYVSEDPREFFLVVDASHLDWSVTVDEGVAATIPDTGRR